MLNVNIALVEPFRKCLLPDLFESDMIANESNTISMPTTAMNIRLFDNLPPHQMHPIQKTFSRKTQNRQMQKKWV